MIRAFKGSDTVFTSNGDKIIKPIDAVITKNTEEEYLELEAPLRYAEFLVQDNILVVDTLTGKKGYRIHNPTKDKVVSVKAMLIYQESIINAADRGVTISYGKNIEDCKVAENWDDVVTKITPTGYNGATLPEGYLSVTSPHQRVYEKIGEFPLSGNLESTIETLEEAIETGASNIANLQAFITVLASKITACDSAIINLQADIATIQAKIATLGTSDAELKEKAVLEAQILTISAEIGGLTSEKVNYQNAKTASETELVTAQSGLATAQATYNNTIITDLRTQAQAYLTANTYPHINYDLSAHLEGIIEVGDTVKVKHERLGIDMLAYVTAYKFDCLTSKFKDIQFGTQRVSLKSKISGMEQNIKTVADTTRGNTTSIEQLSDQIILRVDANGRVGLFKLSGDANGTQVLIKADNINLEGLVTANGFFKILPDGSTKQVNGDFSGKIRASSFIGGSIESENYEPDVSGSKFYLNDGALDTKYVKWDSEGRVKITGGAIDIATDSQEKSLLRFTYGAMQMSLTPSSFKLTNTTSGKSIYIYNFTSIPNIGLYDGTGRVVELSTNGIDMPTKPIICGDLSSNGGEVLTTQNYASKGIAYPASTSGFTGSLIMGASRINVSDGLITGVSSA